MLLGLVICEERGNDRGVVYVRPDYPLISSRPGVEKLGTLDGRLESGSESYDHILFLLLAYDMAF